jgi:hypothetical protein
MSKRSKVIPFRPKVRKTDEPSNEPSIEEELHAVFMQELEKRIQTEDEAEVLCVLTILFFATSIVPEAIAMAKDAVVPSVEYLTERECSVLPELEKMIEDLDSPEIQKFNRDRIDEAVFLSGSFGSGIKSHPVELVYCPIPIVAFIGNEKIEEYLQSDIAKRTIIKVKGAKTAAYINFGL